MFTFDSWATGTGHARQEMHPTSTSCRSSCRAHRYNSDRRQAHQSRCHLGTRPSVMPTLEGDLTLNTIAHYMRSGELCRRDGRQSPRYGLAWRPKVGKVREVPLNRQEGEHMRFSHSPIDSIQGARRRLAADVMVERLGLNFLLLDLEDEILPDPSARFCMGPVAIIRLPLIGAHCPFREMSFDPTWGHLLQAADRSICLSAGRGSHTLKRIVKSEAQQVQLWFSAESSGRRGKRGLTMPGDCEKSSVR